MFFLMSMTSVEWFWHDLWQVIPNLIKEPVNKQNNSAVSPYFKVVDSIQL